MIQRPSVASLLLRTICNEHHIGNATAFIAKSPDREGSWLVTNWHVVTGRHPQTRQPLDKVNAAVPDSLGVWHHVEGELGSWKLVVERLYDDSDQPLWLEHPTHGANVDVVALPITNLDGVAFFPYDPWVEGAAIQLAVARPLSIVGFPFGHTAGALFPIWLQGWIASEPEVNVDDLPKMFIDARTRQSQSGSPVIAFTAGGAVTMDDGSFAVLSGPAERLVGVYSGRISEESDIGIVWKRGALVEILEGRHRGSPP